jgi:hypothetical protein
MNCCPTASFQILAGGLQVTERNLQDSSSVLQFFPFRAIQSVRYYYSRDDRESQLSIWISSQGTPGAGGLSFRWKSCDDSVRSVYEQLIGLLT